MSPNGNPNMELRDYQQRAIELLDKFQTEERATFLQAPTGAGKTVMLALWLLKHPARKILILVHRQELLVQVHSTLMECDHPITDITPIGGTSTRSASIPHTRITVAMQQTAVRRTGYFAQQEYDLIVVDEAHHAAASTWTRLLALWPNAKLVGLSATPHRLDGLPLRDAGFTGLILARDYGGAIQDLIRMKHLHDPVILTALAKADREGGRYSQAALQKIFDLWLAETNGALPTIFFLSRQEQCKELASWMETRGITTRTVVSSTKAQDRIKAIDDYKAGRVQVLLTVAVLTEGFDAPLTQCVVLARTTDSLVLYLQCVGRLLRWAGQGKTALILDCCGLTEKHGHPTQEHHWNLDGAPRKEANKAPLTGQRGDDQKIKHDFWGFSKRMGALLYWDEDGYPPLAQQMEQMGLSRAEIDRVAGERLKQATDHPQLLTWAYCHNYGRVGIAYQIARKRGYPLLRPGAEKKHWALLQQRAPYGQTDLGL